MILNELFDNPVKFYRISANQYIFNMDKYAYEVFFRESLLPKFSRERLNDLEATGIEIEFILKNTTRSNSLSITNTGNSIQVFSTVLKIIIDFIENNKPKFFYFSAYEPSRIKLYNRLTKVLIKKTNYELFDVLENNYGKNYIFSKK